jgi:hypothetical protein
VGTITLDSIKLNWTDPTPGETRFELSYKLASNTAPPAPVVTLPANTTTFTHTGVAPGTQLDYNVRGCDANGCSDWSNTIRAEANAKKLTVQRDGAGLIKGVGINCGTGGTNDCTQTYSNGTVVTLTATPYANSHLDIYWTFDHWEGACSGSTTNVCTLTMTGNKTAKAVFVQD